MPDEPRITQNISVTKGDIHSMKPRPKMKDKVVVRLHEWKDPKRPPRGFITEVLGKSHTPGEYLGILREYQLDPEFPLLVEEETREISKTVEKVKLEEGSTPEISLQSLSILTMQRTLMMRSVWNI